MTPFGIAAQIFLFPVTVFARLLAATNTMGFYYAMFALVAVYRLLVVPIIGAVTGDIASDMVRKRKPPTKRNK